MATRTSDADVWGRESIVAEIVRAVARAEGTDPVALAPPLASVIDPEALEALVQNSRGVTTLRFEYRGWLVSVTPDGVVSLEDVEGQA